MTGSLQPMVDPGTSSSETVLSSQGPSDQQCSHLGPEAIHQRGSTIEVHPEDHLYRTSHICPGVVPQYMHKLKSSQSKNSQNKP